MPPAPAPQPRSWRLEPRRSSGCQERRTQMADALLLPRRFLAPSSAVSAASSSASSPPPCGWVLSPVSPRRARPRVPASPPACLVRGCLMVLPSWLFQVHAAVAASGEQPKWWEENAGSNMIDIHSTVEFLDALRDAGDWLVIVVFYGTWCGSCRALFPRFQKLKDAIAVHNTARCSIGPPAGVGDVDLRDSASPQEKPAEASSR